MVLFIGRKVDPLRRLPSPPGKVLLRPLQDGGYEVGKRDDPKKNRTRVVGLPGGTLLDLQI